MATYGVKTWRKVDFEEVIKTPKDQIIGLSFPRSDLNLGLEPSVLSVLPDGDNVYYDMKNRDHNDCNVQLYLCSVYISGMEEFVSWAQRHDTSKIVVGGYHPTTFPEDFERYAFKIVQGPCDDIWGTIKQPGKVVKGIVNHKRVPRRDLYDIKYNQQIIPDKKPKDVVVSINTSQGCAMKPPCDFCCTPIMCPILLSRPLEAVEKEVRSLVQYKPKFLFIRDENFTMQKDWTERLQIIHGLLPKTKIYLFASANTLKEPALQEMAKQGVYMICLGLEDITVEYTKNRTLDQVVRWMKNNGIMTYLSFIVNPHKVIGREAGKDFYDKLMSRFHELAPEMVCGNFLMPFRGTALWDQYYAFVSPEDYKFYDSKTPFLIRNPIVREKMQFFMFWYQWKYYTSDFYNNNVRKFETGDTLHLRFLELYDQFSAKYQKIWNVRP